MADTLATLIKVHQHEVDAQRRVLAELQAIVDRMQVERATLHARRETEKEVSRHDAEAAQRWPDFLDYAIRRDKELLAQIATAEREVDAARDELQRRFESLKKFELAKQAADLAEAKEQARQEQIELDEIASNQNIRK